MTYLTDLAKRAEKIRKQYEELNALNGKDAWRIRDYSMALSGDIGDLMKLVMAKENVREMENADAKLGHELADCLWSIMVIANYYNVDLEGEFKQTMDRIEEKIQRAKL